MGKCSGKCKDVNGKDMEMLQNGLSQGNYCICKLLVLRPWFWKVSIGILLADVITTL